MSVPGHTSTPSISPITDHHQQPSTASSFKNRDCRCQWLALDHKLMQCTLVTVITLVTTITTITTSKPQSPPPSSDLETLSLHHHHPQPTPLVASRRLPPSFRRYCYSSTKVINASKVPVLHSLARKLPKYRTSPTHPTKYFVVFNGKAL
jgi:hypothetical protein